MEWTRSKRQPSPNNKFWTLPRHVSHMYQDKPYASDLQHAAAFQQQQTHTQSFSRECDRWTATSPTMGGILQDYTNWTDQPVSYIPGGLNNESHSQNYSGYRKQEIEWRKPEVERARKQQISESRRQTEEWRKRWEQKTPPNYLRDIKANQSDASHLELEARAARYSQSLSRMKHMDTRIRGTYGVQGVQDRVKIPDGIHRASSNDAQRIFHSSEQYNHNRGWEQKHHRQLMVPHSLPQLPILGKTWGKDRKENNPSLQQRVFNQPPQYIPPPPYSAPHTIKHQENAYKYSTLPVPRKQEFYGALLKEGEGYEKWKRTKWMDIDSGQRQVGNRTWKDPTLKLPPEGFAQLVSPKHSEMMADPGKVVSAPPLASSKTTFKKKRGGNTVFCLVSQPQGVARLTTSPEEHLQSSSLQRLHNVSLTNKENVRTDISKAGWIESISGCQTEVDSGVTQSKQPNKLPTCTANRTSQLKVNCNSRHYCVPSWLHNKQATSYREELVKVIQERPKNIAGKTKNPPGRDETMVMCSKVNVPPVMKKKTLQLCSAASSKFPLWKESSYMASPRNISSIQCIKSNLELQSEELNQYEMEMDSSHFINKSMAKQKEGTASNRGDGILVIDATCVVVRADFIPPPKREQVQYIYPPQGQNYEVFRGPSSDISQHDLDISPRNITMQCSTEVLPERPLQEPKSENDQKCTSELSQNKRDADLEDVRKICLLSPVAFESECLAGRPLRILGVTVHKSNDKETNRDQRHVLTHGKSQGLSIDVSPAKLETDTTKELEQLNSFGDTLSFSDDQFLTDLGKSVLSDLDRATALEQKLRTSKGKELNDIGHSMPNVSEKYTVINHAEKQDIFMSENICSKEPLPFPHTKQEMSNCTEGIPFSPPRFHSLSSQQLVLPSISHSLSPSLSHTPPYHNLESLSDFPSLSLDTTDTDCISLPHPLCHPITISPDSGIKVVTPSPQSSEGHSLPCSLWDAVSRIRRHTAPDSENEEEEEAGEIWDNQENMRKEAEINRALFDLGSSKELEKYSMKKNMLWSEEDLDLMENGSTRRTRDQNKKCISANGANDLQVEKSVLLSGNTGLNDIQQYGNELQRQCEEDTLSWSSSDSHTSRDTVIMSQETQISEEAMSEGKDYVSWLEGIGSPKNTA